MKIFGKDHQIQELEKADDITVKREDGVNSHKLEGKSKISMEDEDKTVSLEDYERKLNRLSEKEMTVRLSEIDLEEHSIDPVAIALSEPEQDRIYESYFKNDMTRDKSFSSFEKDTEIRMPVGWMVCIEGSEFGKSFTLQEGSNSIQVKEKLLIRTITEFLQSKTDIPEIEYLEDERSFRLSPGHARELVYVNDELIFKPTILHNRDIVTVGEYSMMLIVCCNEKFSWRQIQDNR